MATPQQNLARLQEIANRGLQDQLSADKRARFDEATRRGLITLQPTTGEQALGVAEAALSVASTIPAELGSGLTFLGTLAATGGDIGAAEAVGEATRQALTFDPRTEEGQKNLQSVAGSDVIQAIGGALETAETTLGDLGFDIAGPVGGALGKVIPVAILEATGLIGLRGGQRVARRVGEQAPRAARAAVPAVQETARAVQGVVEPATRQAAESVFEFQTPTKQRIAQLLEEGATDVETAGFELRKSLRGERIAVKSGVETEAIKQGFDKGVVAALKQASPVDRGKMRQMVDIMEKGKKNAQFALRNRPSDVVGNSLLDRVKVVREVNRASGKEIDKVATGLKGKPVDIADAAGTFANRLDELGVSLVSDGKGGFKPDFELSQLSPGDRGPIKEVIRQMNIQGRGGVDALTAHKMKRIIDNNVTFGKSKSGSISRDAEGVLKEFRTAIDDSLDRTYPDYNEANIVYRDTITALDSLQSAAGKNLDLSGGNADKALGTLMRRLMSNAQSRVNLLDAVDEIESVSKKHGGKFRDVKLLEGPESRQSDLLSQVLFVDELDRQFGAVARTSFQGQIQQGIEQAGRATTRAGAADLVVSAVGKAAEKARGINEANAFKAIKNLLGE